MCATLSDFGEVTALEPFAPAADICRSKPYVSLVPSIEQLEKADQVFDLVGAFDVLEHIEDDKKFIAQISEHMDKGAIFIATVPAYQFLWSNHDVAHRHCRRYTRRTLMKLFTEAGFAILYVSYWNRLLLPLAIVARLFGRTGDSRAKPGSIGDRLRYRIVRSEVSLMPAKRFACGTGIVIVAEKIRK
jgi:SAM-dependent methyltransferase